jgi:hypothetical protein
MRLSLIIIAILLLSGNRSFAQTKPVNEKFVQFSGLVLTSDSLRAIPFCVISRGNHGVAGYSDINGFFSFVAQKGDTVNFWHVEYESSQFVIPDTITRERYYFIMLLTQDTINLSVVVIRAFPTRAAFDHVFVHKEIPADELERARKNLESEELKEQMRLKQADARESYRSLMQQRAQLQYYQGQAPPMNIMSPLAWSQFFEAWKRGDFKKKKK